MCQLLTTVAQKQDFEYVAYCEHRVIHLGWHYATFHLQPADFLRIVRLLEQSVAAADFTQLWGDQRHCCLVRQQNGCFQLWLGNTVLFLTFSDLPRLIELVRLALPQLSHVFSSQSYPSWPGQTLLNCSSLGRSFFGPLF
jgi:hypothetical protein